MSYEVQFSNSENTGTGKRRGVKQLMYQIPVRWSDMDSDYVIYAGYRLKSRLPNSYFVRTDIGVDFAEDKVNLNRQREDVPVVHSPASKLRKGGARRERQHDAVFDLTRIKLDVKNEPCTTWKAGDIVVIGATKETVEILERGLKGNELVVKIKYLDQSNSPGCIVEVPLLELMTIGNLVRESDVLIKSVNNDNEPIEIKRNSLLSPSPSPQQPYYRQYSKPNTVYGILHNCFARCHHSGGVDTVDAVKCDAPRFRPTTAQWFATPKKTEPAITFSKLLNDPEAFQEKRQFFEDFFISTEEGLKPKTFTETAIIQLDDVGEVGEVDEAYVTALSFPELDDMDISSGDDEAVTTKDDGKEKGDVHEVVTAASLPQAEDIDGCAEDGEAIVQLYDIEEEGEDQMEEDLGDYIGEERVEDHKEGEHEDDIKVECEDQVEEKHREGGIQEERETERKIEAELVGRIGEGHEGLNEEDRQGHSYDGCDDHIEVECQDHIEEECEDGVDDEHEIGEAYVTALSFPYLEDSGSEADHVEVLEESK